MRRCSHCGSGTKTMRYGVIHKNVELSVRMSEREYCGVNNHQMDSYVRQCSMGTLTELSDLVVDECKCGVCGYKENFIVSYLGSIIYWTPDR